VASHEDDRYADTGLDELGLEVGTADLRQADVQDQTARNLGQLVCGNSAAEPKASTRKPTDRKIAERQPHRIVVVNDEDSLLGLVGRCHPWPPVLRDTDRRPP
jgi:hypothetical protein